MIHDIKKQRDKLHKTFYYQFDWTYNGITLLHFKWYPTGKGDNGFNLFYPQKWAPYDKKWKDVVRVSNELRQVLMSECQELWGQPKVLEKAVIEKPKVKMVQYGPAFGPDWVSYSKFEALIIKNFDRWTADGMLIEER